MNANSTPGPANAWLYVVARSRAEGEWQAPVSADAAGGVSEPSPFAAKVRECLAGLPRLQREVLLADLAAGGRVAAVVLAKKLDTSPNAVYVSRNLGRKALHAALVAHGVLRAGG